MKYIQDIIGKTVVIASVSLALSTMPRNVLAQTATVTINLNETHQTIDGFGAAQFGWDPLNPDAAERLYTWPEPHKSKLMDLAFSQANGIGLTILRMKVNPMLEPSPGEWNDYDPWQVWIMREAVKRGPVKLIASVTSPPVWMKDPPNISGGSLKPENYQDFADFLAHYAGQYAFTNGVNIYAVSMSNEHDTVANWDTCVWTGDQIATFLSRYLSRTLIGQRRQRM